MKSKKILIVGLLVLLLVITACNSLWPINTYEQENFCKSKGMTYKSGSHKGYMMWCDKRVYFTYQEFFEYTQKSSCLNVIINRS